MGEVIDIEAAREERARKRREKALEELLKEADELDEDPDDE